MFIRVRNENKNVDRRFLELLGAGDKRNDDRTIGMFGSGTMYAPIAMLRRCGEYVVCGNDAKGPYKLQYEVVNEGENFQVIYFDYNNGDERVRSSFTLDAGGMDWTKPFQIIREPITNAMDEEARNGYEWSVELVDEIGPPVPGYFDVYLTAEPELRNIVKNFDTYFSTKRTSLANTSYGRIINAIDGKLRIYYKDVLVGEKEDRSLFNYSMHNAVLNEDRTLKNFWQVNRDVAYMLAETDSKQIINRLISTANDDYWEHGSDLYGAEYASANELWEECWKSRHGSMAIPVEGILSDRIDRMLRKKGYKPVVVTSTLVKCCLKLNGIKFPLDVLAEKIDYDIVEEHNLSGEEHHTLQYARTVVQHYEPAIDRIPLKLFKPTVDQKGVLGEVKKDHNGNPYILLSTDNLRNGVLCTVETLVHELDHAISDAPDLSREFRDEADYRLAKLMLNNFRQSFMAEPDGEYVLVEREFIKYVDEFDYELDTLFGKVFVKFGHKTFLIEGCETSVQLHDLASLLVEEGKVKLYVGPYASYGEYVRVTEVD